MPINLGTDGGFFWLLLVRDSFWLDILNVSLIFDLVRQTRLLPGFAWLGVIIFYGEFDPGSGRTLAACLTHASRTMILGACSGGISGERVSNT